MQSTVKQLRSEANWPPEEGEVISFKSSAGNETGILNEVHWGLVWRDFILEDGRVIPEHRILGSPQPKILPQPGWILANGTSLSGQS